MAIEQKPGDLEKKKDVPAEMPEAKEDLKVKKGDEKAGAEEAEPKGDEVKACSTKPN